MEQEFFQNCMELDKKKMLKLKAVQENTMLYNAKF